MPFRRRMIGPMPDPEIMMIPMPSRRAFVLHMLHSAAVAIGVIAAGLFVGSHMYNLILSAVPGLFAPQVRPELLFYPPIAVLIVDTLHTIAAKID